MQSADAAERSAVSRLLEAAELASSPEDFERLLDRVDAVWIPLFIYHRQDFGAWLQRVPDEFVAARPRLRVARDFLFGYSRDMPARAELARQKADAFAISDDMAVADLAVVSFVGTLLFRVGGDFDRALDLARHAQDVARRRTVEWSGLGADLRSVLHLHWGLAHYFAGDLASAVAEFHQSYWCGLASELQCLAKDAAGKAAVLHALVDDLESAEAWVARSEELAGPPRPVADIVENWAPLAAALVAAARTDASAAREALGSYTDPPVSDSVWSVAAYVRSRVGLTTGQVFGVADRLDRLRDWYGRAPRPGSVHEALATAARVDLALALGQPTRAATLLASAQPSPLLAVARARCALALGDDGAVVAHAVVGLSSAATDGFGRIDLLLCQAVAERRLGRDLAARTTFSRAVELMRSSGAVFPLALVPYDDLLGLAGLVPGAQDLLEQVHSRTGVLMPGSAPPVELTEREHRVLVELARTGSHREIAATLFVSINTVKSQVRSLYRKLGVRSRDEALATAIDLGFALHVDEP